MKLTYYQDPGHGWVKVPRKLLTELGVADKVSSFSYQRGDFVYLEEDCDADLVLRLIPDAKLILKNANRSSKIRSYDSYHFK